MDSPDETAKACLPCSAWWRFPALLVLLLAAIVLFRVGMEDATVQPIAADPQNGEEKAGAATDQVVTLSIESGDGTTQQLEPVIWREGMTVEDLMRASASSDRQAEVRGTGASAMLITLGGKSNEGANGRNWIYKVNGKHADRSFAVYELAPGDQVLWTFAAQR